MNTKTILGYAQIAATLDVPVKTVRAWKMRGNLPAPDVTVGQSPGWKPATLEAFFQHYREHGHPGLGRGVRQQM